MLVDILSSSAGALGRVCLSDKRALFDAYKAASLANGATYGVIAYALIRHPLSALRVLFLSRWPFQAFLIVGAISSTVRGFSDFIPMDLRLDVLLAVATVQIVADIPAVFFTWRATRPLS